MYKTAKEREAKKGKMTTKRFLRDSNVDCQSTMATNKLQLPITLYSQLEGTS